MPASLNNSPTKMASDDRVAVTHNRAWKAMEPDDVVEESQRHRLCGLRVAEGHKVSHLGEAIDDCQDD
jgi:hypothetical protein